MKRIAENAVRFLQETSEPVPKCRSHQQREPYNRKNAEEVQDDVGAVELISLHDPYAAFPSWLGRRLRGATDPPPAPPGHPFQAGCFGAHKGF